MNCVQYLISLHKFCSFQTTEGTKVGPASNSELKRWFKNRAVEINGQTDWFTEEEIPPLIYSLVLFPKNKK